ncbi:SDR family NAD(P)-dependent oxidoreductase [Actinomyces glycerinitolerans]|uniref:Short-chain dehydrogenase/reductase sdr n=1 Tax=Actinomyces glycerinitolerans TaxID=1892869 RepID=A0A1M4RXY8_9ACTO|nr:SDR family NAD(P)-dependent oxidoreductase [Actinomyces glycerinitolerans]SHE24801.1 short-chain dehydrogenase/reductase sdr [Actinomyces glycerinitolerans]
MTCIPKSAGLELQGKTAVLSGATAGVGAQVALTLARHGASICLLTHNLAEAGRLVNQVEDSGGHAWALSCMVEEDAQSYAAFNAARRHFDSGIDIVFTNMGLMPDAPTYPRKTVANLEPSDWRSYMGTALQGVINSTAVALKIMREQDSGGTIINTAFYGMRPRPGLALYNASRSAIRSLVETVNLEAAEGGAPVSAYLLDCESEIDCCGARVVELVLRICAGAYQDDPGLVVVDG